MDFNDALVIVHTYAVAAREGLKEEFAVPESPTSVTDEEKVSKAFEVVEARVLKYISEKKMKVRR